MRKTEKTTIEVRGTSVTVLNQGEEDYISLSDIARYRDAERTDYIIQNWLRNRNTIEFLGIWEGLNNPGFNSIEFDGFRKQAGINSFILTPKQWIAKTSAIGLVSKPGRYGGTYAHKDIAFEFASWISVEFKLYLIKEFQRLKEDENRRLSLAWNLNRTLSKLNYHIHTDAIKARLIPPEITPEQAGITYANEADLLNVALFGQTAKQWRDQHPGMEGNMRDYATIEQLLVLANMESLNAELIHIGWKQGDRLRHLNEIAIRQMRVLTAVSASKQLKE
ncbi:MAG TPA: KilA-N domain-containing protein [Candidatus Hydrogenedentes bacterium]|nr:KilA-N domain-containing protein [Candidatus Hydrogenedentota bacterium]